MPPHTQWDVAGLKGMEEPPCWGEVLKTRWLGEEMLREERAYGSDR